jgi:phenylacetate-CoA ligase
MYTKPLNRSILFVGPLPPPVGGVSIHIKRLAKIIEKDFSIDYVDESSQLKNDYFNLRTYRLMKYIRKVRNAGLIYIHSGKRQLVIFHLLAARFFGKKVILTVHAYPNTEKNFSTFIDSFFYSLAHKIIVVNSFIPDRVKLPGEKVLVRCAFLPPVMEDEPDLPESLVEWLTKRKKAGDFIITANAYQLKIHNSQDLYGLDLCIEVAGRLVRRGFPVSFVYVVSSVDKNRDMYLEYKKIIDLGDFSDHFLLLNEQISFVKLITWSDIVLRPTNTDGDALTVREALYLGRHVIASDVIPRPEGTILFKCRDTDDLEEKIVDTISIGEMHKIAEADQKEYYIFYKGLIENVIANGLIKTSPSLINIKDQSRMLAEKIPPMAGVLLNHVPFSIRLGNDYKKYYNRADKLMKADFEAKNEFIIENFNKIFCHFRQNSPFYNSYLEQAACTTSGICSFDDIASVPLITKAALRELPLESRTILRYGLKQVNTGGTSGSPLSFFLENNFYSREWSHIHYMWRRLGYKPNMTKITIRGKNISDIYSYRFNQNEFLINSYYSFKTKDYKDLLEVFKRYNTEFIHGYPSAIYNFLKEVSINAPFLLEFLKKNIKGIMLGSEYPSPHFRHYIEDLLTENTISWYGHTEGVILAGELNQKYVYVPFLSYGYTEAVKTDNLYHLVGTTFDNYATPFIRYDTEDLINPKFDEYGMLESFRITEGRLGEFVRDKNNKKISLTALIFGRHHKLFDKVNFIQVKQTVPGQIIVFYSNSIPIDNPADLFDSTNLEMEVLFEQIKESFKTSFGKIPLLIK